MDKSAFDIAMKFVLKGGGAVWGECALDVYEGDPLMKDFNPITSYDNYSNFFEVQSFDFSMSVEPDDAGAGNLSRGGGSTRGILQQARPGAPHAAAAPASKHSGGDAFQRWRSATEAEARQMKFQMSFDSFRFSRVIDGASPLFFQACARQQRFESAALVKRVSTGLRRGASRQSLAFMRMDFKDVLLKSVKWDDGELVTEACEFVCNSLSYQYRQQAADGTLLPVQSKAEWDRGKDSERRREGAS